MDATKRNTCSNLTVLVLLMKQLKTLVQHEVLQVWSKRCGWHGCMVMAYPSYGKLDFFGKDPCLW
jgi:hypothetical protein